MAASVTRTADPASAAGTANVVTYSGVSTGVAAADRVIAIPITWEANLNLLGVTIESGGGDATAAIPVNVRFSTTVGAAWAVLHVPIGTTATIKVTFSGNPSVNTTKISVYRVLGASFTVASTASNTSTDMDATAPLTASVTIPTNGLGLACAGCATNSTASKTWTSFTEDLEDDVTNFCHTVATKTTSGTANCVCTGSTNLEDGAMAIVVFSESLSGPAHEWNSRLTEKPPATSYPAPVLMDLRTWLQASTGLRGALLRPANQFDWPLPIAREFPISLRTWTVDFLPLLPPNYMPSRVVDWGTWEDPRKAQTYIAVNPALLSPTVVNKPVQSQWTLPIGQDYPVDLRTFARAPRAPDARPQQQVVWDLPTAPVYPSQLRTWSAKPQAPNPPPQRQSIDWSLPVSQVYPISLRTWTRAPQVTVAVSLPVNQYDWPLPRGSTWQAEPSPPFATIARDAARYMPGGVSDWGTPAPVEFAQPWQQPFNVALLTAQAVSRPANQLDWPLPIQAQQVIRTWLQGPRVATGLKPVLVADWPLPIRMAQPVRTWTQAPQPAQVVSAKPVNQSDWSLPLRRADEEVKTWIQSPNASTPVTYIPSRVVDWGTQEPQRSIDVAFHFNAQLKSVAAVTLPRNQYDWPLPARVDYPISLRSWVNAGIQIEYVFRAPYYSLRWKQPYFNYDLAPFAVALRTPAAQKPVNQSDWPLPILRTRDAVGYTFSPRAPERMPVNQYNWPLPIVRTRDAVGYTFAPRAPDRMPVNQDDWPLPIRRTPDAITYTRSPQFGAPEQMPVNQDDWPLPIRRTREAITWTQSPNFAQQVQPRPVNNFDGSIPIRPQTFIQAVQQSNIVIQASASARPVNQYDWPVPAQQRREVLTWISRPQAAPEIRPVSNFDLLAFPRRVSQLPTWFDQQTTALHTPPLPVNQDDWPLPSAAQRMASGYGYFFAPFLARRPEAMPPTTAVFPPPIGYHYPNELRSFLRSPPTIVPAPIPPPRRRPTPGVGRGRPFEARPRDFSDPRSPVLTSGPRNNSQ